MILKIEKYSAVIANNEIGKSIYGDLLSLINRDEENIVLDFEGISVMTTFCAKQIFGKLYLDLGGEKFYSIFSFKNVSEDLKIIIQNSIQDAVDDQID